MCFSMTFDQILLVLVLSLLYLGGIVSLILAVLILLQGLLKQHFEAVIYVLALMGLAVLFIFIKMDYLKIDVGRTFRDSLSYVSVAEQPLTSMAFWANIRPFTLPLVLKFLGTHTQNYQTAEQLKLIAQFQVVFSILCWGALAAVLAASNKVRWLGVVIFGLVLSFSLSPEISLWDSLLLSESVSYSLFALMVAAWVGLLTRFQGTSLTWRRWAWLLFTVAVSTLYAFVRDSNVYFVLIGAAAIGLACQFYPKLFHLRKEAWIYAGFVVVILVTQNLSLSGGNRWQIFIYDHLAVRILKNPEAVQFFADEGLAIDEHIMKTTRMAGFEYQKYFIESAEMQPVRDWVNCCGKNVYMKYLLSHPWQTLMEPIQNNSRLLNGDNLEYRSPRYDVRPLPEHLAEFNHFYFNHENWVLMVLGLAILIEITLALHQGKSPVWLVLLVLVLSIYPMMFLVWHGEPLEIERHAAQIGVQFRLAGWVSLAMLLGQAIAPFLPDNKSVSMD